MRKYTFATRNPLTHNEAVRRAEKWINAVKSEGEYWTLIQYKTHDRLNRKVYHCEVRFVSFYTRIA